MKDGSSLRISQVLLIAGANISFLTGPSFGAGSHTLQFHASQGMWGYASIAIALVMSALVVYLAFSDIERFNLRNLNDVFNHYCGKYLGAAIRWVLIVVYLFDAGSMLSGASSMLNVACGIPPVYGAIFMEILAVAVLVLASERFVGFLGKASVGIIILIIGVGVCSLASATGSLSEGAEVIAQASESVRISDNPVKTGLLQYTGTTMFDMGILATMVTSSKASSREMRIGGTLSMVGYSCLMVLIITTLFCNAGAIAGSDVPLMSLAVMISPVITIAFAVMLILATLTSVTGEVWIITRYFFDEESKWRKPVSVALTIFAYGITFLGPYGMLANIAFKACSYVGVLFAVCFFATKLFRNRGAKKM